MKCSLPNVKQKMCDSRPLKQLVVTMKMPYKFSWVMVLTRGSTHKLTWIFVVNNFINTRLLRKLQNFYATKIWHYTVCISTIEIQETNIHKYNMLEALPRVFSGWLLSVSYYMYTCLKDINFVNDLFGEFDDLISQMDNKHVHTLCTLTVVQWILCTLINC